MTLIDKLNRVETLLKHQPGRHDQKTHGRRAGRGGDVGMPPSDVGAELIADAKAEDFLSPENRGFWANYMDAETGRIDPVAYDIGRLQEEWGDSASSAYSLGMQQAAAEEFGVEASEYQREHLRKLESEGVEIPSVDRKLLRKVYDDTQQQLTDAGIETLVLYRGAYHFGDDASVIAKAGMGATVGVKPDSLESWTSDPGIAVMFAQQEPSGTYRAGAVGVVYQMEVPASRVMSTYRTGFGSAQDKEFVLLGNVAGKRDTARVVYVEEQD